MRRSPSPSSVGQVLQARRCSRHSQYPGIHSRAARTCGAAGRYCMDYTAAAAARNIDVLRWFPEWLQRAWEFIPRGAYVVCLFQPKPLFKLFDSLDVAALIHACLNHLRTATCQSSLRVSRTTERARRPLTCCCFPTFFDSYQDVDGHIMSKTFVVSDFTAEIGSALTRIGDTATTRSSSLRWSAETRRGVHTVTQSLTPHTYPTQRKNLFLGQIAPTPSLPIT